ncbi:MAG: hypothetical protein EXR79_11595 [Myxococcales bacterium]|nr:hypothetical protein [Myxococcales bacterium]
MSRRSDPSTKRSSDVLDDLLAGHREASYNGPKHARRYLENALSQSKSMPNAVKFFAYDLLAEACGQLDDSAACLDAVALAILYLPAAQEDAERAAREWLPSMRAFESGIAAAVEAGRYVEAVQLCEQAGALGLGAHYERKRASIERMAGLG